MPDTGLLLPSAFNTVGAGTAWVNKGNGFADDGANVTVTLGAGGSTEFLNYEGFGFAIPSDKVVYGVEVQVGDFTDSAPAGIVVNLTKDYNLGNSIVSHATNLTSGTQVVGSPTDLWGFGSLTPAEVNASSFGCFITATDVASSIAFDYIKIRVTYGDPPTAAVSSVTRSPRTTRERRG